jgi:hypothetical protein
MKITIDGVVWDVDVEAAKKAGILKPDFGPARPGSKFRKKSESKYDFEEDVYAIIITQGPFPGFLAGLIRVSQRKGEDQKHYPRWSDFVLVKDANEITSVELEHMMGIQHELFERIS